VVGSAADVEALGSASVDPEPLSKPPADWELYEGVFVELRDVAITSEIDEYGQFATDGDLLVDDFLLDLDGELFYGDELASLAGVILYRFDEWKVCPRSTADFLFR
jgi:hypothetical protein